MRAQAIAPVRIWWQPRVNGRVVGLCAHLIFLDWEHIHPWHLSLRSFYPERKTDGSTAKLRAWVLSPKRFAANVRGRSLYTQQLWQRTFREQLEARFLPWIKTHTLSSSVTETNCVLEFCLSCHVSDINNASRWCLWSNILFCDFFSRIFCCLQLVDFSHCFCVCVFAIKLTFIKQTLIKTFHNAQDLQAFQGKIN